MNRSELLLRPVPDMSVTRNTKAGYRSYPLLTDARNAEPLVDIAEYGIAGQGYYSRQNAVTSNQHSIVTDPVVYVRKSIAERLAAINYSIQNSPEVEALLGGKVELYVEEGLRSAAVQRELYERVFPARIRKQYPSWSNKMVLERRDQLIARPSVAVGDVPPHATGAAVDVTLRYLEANQRFTKGAKVFFGHRAADMSDRTWPDYFEHQTKVSKGDQVIQRNRRVFYWLMRGALLDDDSGFEANPTEFWHWSHGDQLWAQLRQAPCAFFGRPDTDLL